MKHIFHPTVFLVIIAILLTACCKDADYSDADCVENSEEKISRSFVEMTPFDINENEYRFLIGDTEYVIDLSYFDLMSAYEFDALEELEYKTDIDYIEKRPVTTAEEALSYGMDIFKEYCMRIIGNKASKDEWLLLGVLHDEINDAWGISFAPAPLTPGWGLMITYYSDGEMISFRIDGE